ncbi:MAG: Ger(x)C family spore germination C-terminal domain-containing protein, partial [Ruminococcus sp.]|nr:Ger(x)C family spore germination C-terminal domain-containing protein [Ruminococcus sp.]
ECTVLDFLSDIKSPQFEAMPVAALSQEGSGENKEPVIDITGTALLCGGRLSGFLSQEQSFALSLLRDEAETFPTVVSFDGRSYDVRFENTDVSRSLSIENGRLVFTADITLSAAVSLDIKSGDMPSESIFESYLEANLREAWQNSAGEGCDAAGVWRFLRQRYPKIYLEYEDDIERLIRNTRLDLDINCRIE